MRNLLQDWQDMVKVGEELGNVMEGETSRRRKASAAVNWLSSFGLEIRAPPRICVSYDG